MTMQRAVPMKSLAQTKRLINQLAAWLKLENERLLAEEERNLSSMFILRNRKELQSLFSPCYSFSDRNSSFTVVLSENVPIAKPYN